MWDEVLPKITFPELYSFVRNKSITLQKAKSLQDQLHSIFHLPLSEEAFVQFLELQGLLLNLQKLQRKIHENIFGDQQNFPAQRHTST
jgi:hypothetical protein